MRRFARPLPVVLLALAVVLIATLSTLQYFRLLERASFNVERWLAGPEPGSLDLDSYRVDIEARVIDGLDDNISALTYDPDRKTLFSVTNKRSELIEMSLAGTIVRRIPLVGFGDPEAVEYISPGVYVITDEGEQRLIKITLDDSTLVLDAHDAEQLSLNLGRRSNKGFEGLAYDSRGKRLFVAQERNPLLIYEVQGFPRGSSDKPVDVQIMRDHKRDEGLFVRDLSSLQYDERSGHLLALSDESLLVVELDVKGRPLSTLSLRGGYQGLSRSVPQPEGIAMDDDGNLYMVSEPNLFYVFRKQ